VFEKVEPRVSYPRLEEEILEFWKENDTFKKSVEKRQGRPLFVFYEGPPTANGLPHVGHTLPRVFKDLIPRYKTMCGYHVPRKAGWDTHGLPVELEVEKELGISGKPDIERYGVQKFIERCKESVFRYEKEWVKLTERIGFWIDTDDPYVTYRNDYILSVWWALRRIWDRGLLYRGHKVVPYCPRCGTPLSSHEVAQGYEEVSDPSVYVEFPLEADQPLPSTLSDAAAGAALLVWTTTPWTLPSNAAVAVNPDEAYVLAAPADAESENRRYILAKALVGEVLGDDAEIAAEVKGRALAGLRYRAPFDFLRGDDVHVVLCADFVTLDEGTGVVHMAPAFGEDDLAVGKKHGLPVFQPIDEEGRFTSETPPFEGMFFKDADPSIMDDLEERGLLFRRGTYVHTYPFCWRCDSPLLYYARDSWYIRMTAVSQDLVRSNEAVDWHPSHLKHGRFGDFLENVVDWCLSRERYWGTPLNVWICGDCGRQHCVGSLDELKRMAGGLPEPLDLHKPAIDGVTLTCPECRGEMHRVPDVIDCWFDSGSMPFAQWHYPHGDDGRFSRHFPADYICEAVDQTRGWFYSLMAISTLLFGQAPYRNVLVTEFGVDEEGLKMSKHKGNVIDPWTVVEEVGADGLRWYVFASGAPWYPKRFSLEAMRDLQSKMQDTLWNVYAFFTLYACIDSFDPTEHSVEPLERPAMDRWVLSRLNGTIAAVRRGLDSYEVTAAARALQAFVDDLSNWYVRRCRRRFWKGGMDRDKTSAYLTLHDCLVSAAHLVAPFMPFMAEAMYQNLVRSVDRDTPESVHLGDYPRVRSELIDEGLEESMAELREFVALGRAARNSSGIKTRQPLPEVVLVGGRPQWLGPILEQLREELNVKKVSFSEAPDDYVRRTLHPDYSRIGPRFGSDTPAVVKALETQDAGRAAERLAIDGSVRLEVDGREVELTRDDVEVRVEEAPGFKFESNGDRAVVLDVRVDDALRLEGIAREVVNRIQHLRKDAGLDVVDHVTTYYEASGEIERAIKAHGEFIRRETLSRSIRSRRPEGVTGREWELDGEKIFLGVKKSQ